MPFEPTISVPNFPRATDYAGVWAIESSAGQSLLRYASSIDLRSHVAQTQPPVLKSSIEMVPASNGKQIAIVRLDGTLMKSASSMGGTSTVRARADIRKAANDADVLGILLAVDSPGGTVAGTDDLAKEIAAANKKKPVMAFVSDLCASAAYWAASQSEAIYANSETAWIGSIGTMLTLYDLSKSAADNGVEVLVFGTGSLKGAGTEGTAITEEQRSYFQSLVNDSQKAFDAGVKSGRKMSDKQLSTIRTGAVFGASEAETLGLIDGVQSYEATVAALIKAASNRAKTDRLSSSVPTPNNEGVKVNEAEMLAAQNEAAAKNLERIAGINAVCAGHPAIAAQAIRENWTAEKAENSALKAALAKPPATALPDSVNTGPVVYGSGNNVPGVPASLAIEAAIRMQLSSAKDLEKQYKPEVLEAARQPQYRSVGLQQLLISAASENGRSSRPGERINSGNLREVLGFAFRPSASGGFSTSGLSGILGNVANKELLAGYVEEDTAWMEISVQKSVSNFQVATSYRMLDNMEYEQLAPDGKIKHGSVGEESYTRQVNTFAKMFSLTRTQIINDDLGAFDDVRNRLGRGAAKKMNKVFWLKFTDNSTFFTSGRTNYITGSTTNLGTDGVGLGLGVLNFRKMKSPAADGTKAVNGNGGRPTLLLVPPELEAAANKLYAGENLNVGTAAGETNIYRGKYRPVVAWQLGDSAYTGYSATGWYLLNDPAYLPTMVVSFLNGQMAPVVDSADADFDQLGVQFRGYHDFGCDLAEYLGGLKSKGEA